MSQGKITNLKEFLVAYGSRKSDVEIAQMLSVPIEHVKIVRKNIGLAKISTKQ